MTQIKEQNTKPKNKTLYMVELGLMIAIIVIMSLTPLGYIRTPALSITLLTVPVAVGAIILGPLGGAVCGLAFGATSFYMALSGGSAFSVMLMSISPIGTFITCIIPRILEGYLTGVIFQAMYKGSKSRKISYYVAALSCPLLNTLFFMTSLCLFFYNTEYIQGFVTSLNATNPFVFVLLFVGVQGLIEAAICFVVASVVARALFAALNRM